MTATRTCLLVSVITAALMASCGGGPGGEERLSTAAGHPLWLPIESEAPEVTPDLLHQGRQLYDIRCAVCHGHDGDGLGPASLYLATPPRDFRQGIFKFRTSSTGALPTDLDLFRTVSAGFPAYGMPSFDYLPEEDRWALALFVKTFAERFERQQAPAPLDLGPAPEATPDRVASGRQVFERAQCGKCHGEDGHGFGPSAATLKDGWGHPSRTLDLSSSRIYYKAGFRIEDIMRTFTTGLNGTPMPSYLGAGLEDAELWNLAIYVRSLAADSGG